MPHKYFSVDDIATYVHHAPPTTLPGEPPDLSRGETLLYLHGAGGNNLKQVDLELPDFDDVVFDRARVIRVDVSIGNLADGLPGNWTDFNPVLFPNGFTQTVH